MAFRLMLTFVRLAAFFFSRYSLARDGWWFLRCRVIPEGEPSLLLIATLQALQIALGQTSVQPSSKVKYSHKMVFLFVAGFLALSSSPRDFLCSTGGGAVVAAGPSVGPEAGSDIDLDADLEARSIVSSDDEVELTLSLEVCWVPLFFLPWGDCLGILPDRFFLFSGIF